MNEAEWLASDNPAKMLKCLQDKASGRQLHLFACACCRLAGRDAEMVNEYEEKGFFDKTSGLKWAESWMRRDELDRSAKVNLIRIVFGNPFRPVEFPTFKHQLRSVRHLPPMAHPMIPEMPEYEEIAILPDWARNPTVLAIAQAIYDNRGASGFGPLWDQLETAGCTSEEIRRALAWEQRCPKCLGKGYIQENKGEWHEFRQLKCQPCNGTGWLPIPGEPFMVRGFWVVDLLLGEE